MTYVSGDCTEVWTIRLFKGDTDPYSVQVSVFCHHIRVEQNVVFKPLKHRVELGAREYWALTVSEDNAGLSGDCTDIRVNWNLQV